MPVIKAGIRETSTLQGADYGATISSILDESEPGQRPRLHRHPYDETWVVQEGNLTFQLGETRYHAEPGDIIIAPPGVPHMFTNNGPGRSKLVCIHAHPTVVGEWLEWAVTPTARRASANVSGSRLPAQPMASQTVDGRSGSSEASAATRDIMSAPGTRTSPDWRKFGTAA